MFEHLLFNYHGAQMTSNLFFTQNEGRCSPKWALMNLQLTLWGALTKLLHIED